MSEILEHIEWIIYDADDNAAFVLTRRWGDDWDDFCASELVVYDATALEPPEGTATGYFDLWSWWFDNADELLGHVAQPMFGHPCRVDEWWRVRTA